MIVSLLCLALAYELPDVAALPQPAPAQQQRIVAALAALRDGTRDDVEAAVRDLALVGAPALRAIVARLNEADARERLLLLTAVRPLPLAAPLLKQALSDSSPAVRAWVAPPPRPPATSLKRLAHEYLKALAVVEEAKRKKADKDAQRANIGLAPNTEAPLVSYWRDGMRDPALGRRIEARRLAAARRLAIVGGAALREGTLKPDLGDPVFLAYLALLREENVYHCVVGLTGAGPGIAPVLHELLGRPNHEPLRVLRVLFAVDPAAAGPVFSRRATYPEVTQRALVGLAADSFPKHGGESHVAWLEATATSKFESVRRAALKALLKLPAPAGHVVAARLLDAEKYRAGEFQWATRLLARAGDFEPLVGPALVDVPDDNSPSKPILEALRRECRAALREHREKRRPKKNAEKSASKPLEPEKLEDIAVRLLSHESRRVRALAVEWASRPETLLNFAKQETDPGLATTAALGALDAGGAPDAVLKLFEARGLKVPWSFVRGLSRCCRVDLLIALARGRAGKQVAGYALAALAKLGPIDPRWDADLLALCDAARSDPAADLLLAIGSEEAYRRLEARAAGNSEFELLAAVASRDRLRRPIKLKRFLAGADADRLEDLVRAARAVGDVEPGLFFEIYQAWDKLPPGEREGRDIRDSGPVQEKINVLKILSDTGADVASVRALFQALLAKKIKEPELILGVLRAAAKGLPAPELAALVPRLRKLAAEERANEDREAPVFHENRRMILFYGLRALAYARAPGTIALCSDVFLDPQLHQPAFNWKTNVGVPWWAFEALRHFPAAEVEAEFRAALTRAESDGRLARMHPRILRDALNACRLRRDRGRWLAGVGAALGETLLRLPWEDETGYFLGQQYGALRQYQRAADVMRADGVRKRRAGFVATDGFWTPWRLDERARIYEALKQRDKAALKVSIQERVVHDPLLSHWAGFQALWAFSDPDLASIACERAVRRTAGLYHPFRNWLAAARLRQGRTADALRLLDPENTLPVRRQAQNGWYLLFIAQANARLGKTARARHELELALVQDRRLVVTAKKMPEFKNWSDVFAEADRVVFNSLFEYKR